VCRWRDVEAWGVRMEGCRGVGCAYGGMYVEVWGVHMEGCRGVGCAYGWM